MTPQSLLLWTNYHTLPHKVRFVAAQTWFKNQIIPIDPTKAVTQHLLEESHLLLWNILQNHLKVGVCFLFSYSVLFVYKNKKYKA